MRKTIQVISLILAFAGLASAQQATLVTPVPRAAEDHYQVAELNIRSGAGGQQPQVLLTVSVQDSAGNEIRRANLVIPDSAHPTATVGGFVTALINVRATETGTDPRKANFRVLGYFADNGYAPGVTLVP